MKQNEFEQMARGLRPALLRTALKVLSDEDLAEDVAQDTLLKLWDMRDRLYKYQSVDTLAMIIARNKCLDIVRQRGRVINVSLDDFDATAPMLSPVDEMIDAEADDEADEILAQLPENQRFVLKMKHIDGLEVDEIAAVTGSTPNAIRVTLSRARKRVLEIFNQRK
ncbi:MAG: sigma-70 family RNA polymerase sigma factor [Muribaculaceae bacterium]|nr:sigma-70 family RNA polymerase sigma factor [Muribaculaceae bacterium]